MEFLRGEGGDTPMHIMMVFSCLFIVAFGCNIINLGATFSVEGSGLLSSLQGKVY